MDESCRPSWIAWNRIARRPRGKIDAERYAMRGHTKRRQHLDYGRARCRDCGCGAQVPCFSQSSVPFQSAAVADLRNRGEFAARDVYEAGYLQQLSACDRNRAAPAGPDCMHDIERGVAMLGADRTTRAQGRMLRANVADMRSRRLPLAGLSLLI